MSYSRDREHQVLTLNRYYGRMVTNDPIEESPLLNLGNIRRSISMRTNQQIAYVLDMAKAQALEFLGEDEAAVRLMKRYL